jgi:2-(1,2-epoxy-1,2-dihydrophenyl)acetyl-CoA isomerase
VTELIETSIEDGVAEIRFNRPDSLNTLNVAMAEALATTVERVIADKGTQVVVLSGNGRGFMAGGPKIRIGAVSD